MEKTILNCAVVDDSTLQRLSIVKLIENHQSLNLVAQYNNAIEAKEGIATSDIDLIFLDIEMPILSGFDLLDDLTAKPQIIFVTGKTKYAFKAFDYDAIDYLRKPISKERFLNAVHKAVTNYKLKNEEGFDEEDFIFVKSNLKKRKVFLNELRYIEALGDYVKMVTEHDSLVVLSTMKAFEALLPKDRFLRIHKSYIVNLDKVIRYNSKVIELEKEELPLSRNRKTDLVQALAANNKD
ncbi:LytTR family DNA-binding domain-containing protein [Flavobacteriaceae bacterium]|jgi:DNA-binding LytR/AlgR family response regulator|nr:response regulator transcription factor [Bacteroidota bacterium]MDA8971430.1 LytTR family DNA-binding domain-containing protein [Flavobacteriaceae bacterium]MDB2630198.1 LytTR family DNA-binding domain-containing protein [Ulvibacter sp.]MBT7305027.1 response regulator transcription factor [Bacteroidota bacterium]MDA9215444.1 LytTR family DNA-binding domain-containing protein [Flavobacteriaceae bacterium]